MGPRRSPTYLLEELVVVKIQALKHCADKITYFKRKANGYYVCKSIGMCHQHGQKTVMLRSLRVGRLYDDCPPIKLGFIQGFNCLVALFVIWHFNKTIAL